MSEYMSARMLGHHIDTTTRSCGPVRRRKRNGSLDGWAGPIAALLCGFALWVFL